MNATSSSIVLVTGSGGLIGSEVASHFAGKGQQVFGADNNMRREFFGAAGATRWNQRRLVESFPAFTHVEIDIRDRAKISELIADVKPSLIVHAAAQPSHDLAASRPFDDFLEQVVLEAANRTPAEVKYSILGLAVCGHPLTILSICWRNRLFHWYCFKAVVKAIMIRILGITWFTRLVKGKRGLVPVA